MFIRAVLSTLGMAFGWSLLLAVSLGTILNGSWGTALFMVMILYAAAILCGFAWHRFCCIPTCKAAIPPKIDPLLLILAFCGNLIASLLIAVMLPEDLIVLAVADLVLALIFAYLMEWYVLSSGGGNN